MQRIYFDKADRTLLAMVNDSLDKGEWAEANSLDSNLHPHGIIELTTTHEYRMAHAAVRLLNSLDAGQSSTRLQALTTLHDEVTHSARTQFRYNTGRVLLQLMKDIVRTRRQPHEQLKLMHDFRKAAAGNPIVVRRVLERCHLLEMPEDMSQLTLDYHVHDANTKGRKNPTHLIMDAWIKGIRILSVVYYNYIDTNAARELLQAAEIMGITIRIGIEFCSLFRGRFVHFVWTPRGFANTEDFLAFLHEKSTQALMAEGRKGSNWVAAQVMKGLETWNATCRKIVSQELELELPLLTAANFSEYVGSGQASILHLAEYMHKTYLPLLADKAAELNEEAKTASPERREHIETLIGILDAITPDTVLTQWLNPANNRALACIENPLPETNIPEIMSRPPVVLLDWLSAMRTGYRITLQLSDLTAEDVLELLWDGQGLITHLELFNLKEWQEGRLSHLKEINELQLAMNSDNALHLKRMLLAMTDRVAQSGDTERHEKFKTILHNIATLRAPYELKPLRSRIGTDSTSNASVRHGMGLAVLDTLPPEARKILQHGHGYTPIRVPIHMEMAQRRTLYERPKGMPLTEALTRAIRILPGFHRFGKIRKIEWNVLSAVVSEEHSNVTTMGGGQDGAQTNRLLPRDQEIAKSKSPGFRYLNSTLLGWLKVMGGFIPAQLAFIYTNEWWILTWFGALLWYFITLGRNIVQAVLSGGGMIRSMLTWREYVNWQRIADSLFYTGVSVWILEVMVRRWLLEDIMGYTVSNHAIIVYTVLALCNGVYIAAHNIIRGFPKQAIIGNLFRSPFAIPLAWVFGECLFGVFECMGIANPSGIIQTCAAITSKCASDVVAAVIEGIADSNQNRRLRLWDYSSKLKQIFANYTAIELQLPDSDIMKLMKTPAKYVEAVEAVNPKRLRNCALNAVDMMYFWMYQPYAPQTLASIAYTMTPEERLFLIRSQNVLANTRFISRLFVDGNIGPNFAPALSFYLTQHKNYIQAIHNMYMTIAKKQGDNIAEPDELEQASDIY